MGVKNTYTIVCEAIRVSGIVQGVGFRPTVWRIANACGLEAVVVVDVVSVQLIADEDTDFLPPIEILI